MNRDTRVRYKHIYIVTAGKNGQNGIGNIQHILNIKLFFRIKHILFSLTFELYKYISANKQRKTCMTN